jgi:uncharacterized protein (DUF58 family)
VAGARPGRARPGRARPDRVFGPVAGAVGVLAVWAAVAHASGSEWVQVLGALVAGIVAIGIVAPYWAVRRIRIVAVEAPRDATSGVPFTIVVESNSGCRLLPLRPSGAVASLQTGRPGRVELLPDQRGQLVAVSVRVSSAAPLGILWWSARCRLELPGTVTIAPEPSGPDRLLGRGATEDEGDGPRSEAEHGEMRGVREYRAGDSPRLVHWRSSAHTGTLMVRESEVANDRLVRVVADLSPDHLVAEVEAARVLATVTGLLRRRRRVVLETTERGRQVAAVVRDERDAGRRLARAGTNPWTDLGPPAEPGSS